MSDKQVKLLSDEQLIKWLLDDSEEHRKFFPSDGSYFKMHQQAAARIAQLNERVGELERMIDDPRLNKAIGDVEDRTVDEATWDLAHSWQNDRDQLLKEQP